MGFIYAIATMFLHSFLSLGKKKLVQNINEYIIIWGIALFSIPFLLIFLWIKGIPEINPHFYLWLGLSVLVNVFANILYLKALKQSPLSLTVPFLAFTPLFLLITSWVLLNEFPSTYGLFGILLIVLGAYALNISKFKQGIFAPFKAILHERGSVYMLIVSFLYSFSSNFDKLAVLDSSPLFYVTAFNVSLVTIFSVIIILKRKLVNELVDKIKTKWGGLALLGLIASLALSAQQMAMELTLVPYVISIKRANLILAVIFGYFFFKEKDIRSRLFGAIIMVAGVLLILLFN